MLRALIKRHSEDKQPHSVLVLLAAQAPSPPLALAHARASFLRQLTQHGPSVLRALLYDHWADHAPSSWLQQLQDDVKIVAAYRPSVRDLLGSRNHVIALLDTLMTDPGWWLRQVKAAQSAFLKDAEKAAQHGFAHVSGHPRAGRPADGPDMPDHKPYTCSTCAARFPLRKHLYAHMARSHKIWSPARHFSVGPFCLSCHRWLKDAKAVQLHLKRHDECLRRSYMVIPPMTTADIRQAEADAVQAERQLRRGKWSVFRGPAPATTVYGPCLPTAEERLSGLDFYGESVTLDAFQGLYRPTSEVVQWVEDYLAARSTEGPRESTTSFWHRGPFCTEFHLNSHNFGMRRE